MKYRLYVGRLQPLPEGTEFSYYDSERKRLFVFTDSAPEGKFVPVPDSLLGELTDKERGWYNASCFTVMRRWVSAHEDEAERAVRAFLDQLETELKKEAEKGAEHSDGTEDTGIPSGGD